MPMITLDISKITTEQKRKIIKEFSETASKITSIPKESFVVFINENSEENIGIGGETLADILQKRKEI